MKGIYDVPWSEQPYQWETKRRKDLEFHDEPSKLNYEFIVTHPDHPNWMFRDVWVKGKYGYEGSHTTHTETKQRVMAKVMIKRFVRSPKR